MSYPTTSPPDDGRTWFPTYLMGSISVMSTHGGGRVHDFMYGWGLFSPCGKWFSWDSGDCPHPTVFMEIKFDKWIFPVVKNMGDYKHDIRDILLGTPCRTK